MKRTAFAMALLISSAAVAQTVDPVDSTSKAEMSVQSDLGVQENGDVALEPTVDTSNDAMASAMTHGQAEAEPMSLKMAEAGPLVQPGNINPERDARGIAVISDAAVVPSGWNGTQSSGVGGPADGPDEVYPACTAKLTDNCTQDYEVGKG